MCLWHLHTIRGIESLENIRLAAGLCELQVACQVKGCPSEIDPIYPIRYSVDFA